MSWKSRTRAKVEMKPSGRGRQCLASPINPAGVLGPGENGHGRSQPRSSQSFTTALLPHPSHCSLLGGCQSWPPLTQAQEGYLLGLMEVMTELKWAGFGPNRRGRRELQDAAGIVCKGTKEKVGRCQLAQVPGQSVTASSVYPSVPRMIIGCAQTEKQKNRTEFA